MPTEVELIRNNRFIDPHLHIWGWEIPVYLFLGGLAAGIMILTAYMSMRHSGNGRSKWARWMPFAAPVLLSAGMLALLADLEYKLHVYRFYAIFRPESPMSWGAWILVFIYPATILFGLAELTDEEIDKLGNWKPLAVLRLGAILARVRKWAMDRVSALRWANIALGVALGGYTGILLGTLGARALWNSPILAPLFLVSGFSTAAAFIMLFTVNKEEHHLLLRADVAAIGLEVILLLLFFLGLATGGGTAGRTAVAMFFGGRYTAIFWALVVFAGLLVPLFVEAVEARKHLRPTRVAPVLVLCGGLALRWVLVSAGQL
jgi:formate-dependent nitrite reductase membrane component NrfD